MSKVMVKKLELKTKKLLSPYKIYWMKRGTETQVSKRCCFSFSIGKHYLEGTMSPLLARG